MIQSNKEEFETDEGVPDKVFKIKEGVPDKEFDKGEEIQRDQPIASRNGIDHQKSRRQKCPPRHLEEYECPELRWGLAQPGKS